MQALELIVDEGRPANAGRFFQLGHDLLTLLDEVSEVPVMWRIADLHEGSAVAVIAPPEDEPEEARWLRWVHRSLGEVQQGGALPDHWSPDAVRAAHRLVEHGRRIDGETDWVPPRLRIVGGDKDDDDQNVPQQVDLTHELGSRLHDLQPFERRMPGSVRGQLVGLNVSRGNRASLRLSSHRVVRVGFESGLRHELKDALYRQVELVGVVRQDGDGRVFHVKADSVTVLEVTKARWSDLFGIDPGFTGDRTVEEHLRAGRGEA